LNETEGEDDFQNNGGEDSENQNKDESKELKNET
jgi:hypothetical protein